MSIVSLVHRSGSLLLVACVGLACEKRPAERTDKTPTENAPAPTSVPELRSGKTESSTNVEAKEPMKAADADMKKVVVEMDTLGVKPIASLSVDEARKQPTLRDAAMALYKKDGKNPAPAEMAKVEDKKIPGPGGAMSARVYTPKADESEKKPLPIVVYFHGGGWVLGDVDAYDASARALAKGGNAIVVSADYRRAPEQKFPAAHDDAFAVYEWVTKNAASFGGDPKRVALAGEDAGANLAANTAILARDKNMPMPMHLLLIEPIAQMNMDTRSYKEWANAKPLDKSAMSWLIDKTVRTPADKNDPRLSLVKAPLKGLPPTTIILAEIDPLASDGEMLAKSLEEAGVKVDKKSYEGITHGAFGTGVFVSDAKSAEEYAGDKLKSAFKR